MAGVKPYWHSDPDRLVPFSTLLNVVETYYHPEIRHDNYRELIARARESRPSDTVLQEFKSQLQTLLLGDREGLHPQALTEAAWYDEDDDTAFLLRLWGDLYPDEAPPEQGESSGGERVV